MRWISHIKNPMLGIGTLTTGVIVLAIAYFVNSPKPKDILLILGLLLVIIGVIAYVALLRRTRQ